MSCMGLLCVIYDIVEGSDSEVLFTVIIVVMMTMKLLSESGHKFLEIAQSDSSQILMMSYS